MYRSVQAFPGENLSFPLTGVFPVCEIHSAVPVPGLHHMRPGPQHGQHRCLRQEQYYIHYSDTGVSQRFPLFLSLVQTRYMRKAADFRPAALPPCVLFHQNRIISGFRRSDCLLCRMSCMLTDMKSGTRRIRLFLLYCLMSVYSVS